MVIDLLGPDILMFGSDYPHGESWFPVSVDTVFGWKLKEADMRNFFGTTRPVITDVIRDETHNKITAAPAAEK